MKEAAIIILAIWVIIELVTLFVCGLPITGDKEKLILKLRRNQARISEFDPSILYLSYHGFLTTNPPIPILFKYYINGWGLVLRGSKLCKHIDGLFDEKRKELFYDDH